MPRRGLSLYVTAVLLVSLLGAGLAAAAERVPFPQARPAAAPARSPPSAAIASRRIPFPPRRPYAAPPVASVPAADAADERQEGPSACRQRLGAELAVVVALPDITGPGACGAVDVVRLEAVMSRDGRRMALAPPAVARCAMAEALVHWIRDEVEPAVRDGGAGLAGVTADASFECRGRNRVIGAKLSQHGLANALDIRALTLADGKVFGLTDAAAPKDLRVRLQQSACARFPTVLGPGSDGYHETHVHLDLTERRNGYRICQWDVR
jgi:hypothetical protein